MATRFRPFLSIFSIFFLFFLGGCAPTVRIPSNPGDPQSVLEEVCKKKGEASNECLGGYAATEDKGEFPLYEKIQIKIAWARCAESASQCPGLEAALSKGGRAYAQVTKRYTDLGLKHEAKVDRDLEAAMASCKPLVFGKGIANEPNSAYQKPGGAWERYVFDVPYGAKTDRDGRLGLELVPAPVLEQALGCARETALRLDPEYVNKGRQASDVDLSKYQSILFSSGSAGRVAQQAERGQYAEPLYLQIDPTRIRIRGGNDYNLDGGSFTLANSGTQEICLNGDNTQACFIAERQGMNVRLCDRGECATTLSIPVSNIRNVTPISRNLRIPTSIGVTEATSVTLARSELPGSYRYDLTPGYQGQGYQQPRRPSPVRDARLGDCTPTGAVESRSNFPLYTCERGGAATFTYDGSRMTRVQERSRGRN